MIALILRLTIRAMFTKIKIVKEAFRNQPATERDLRFVIRSVWQMSYEKITRIMNSLNSSILLSLGVRYGLKFPI